MSLLISHKPIRENLQRQIEAFASILLKSGVHPKDRVAIALPRGEDAAIVVYATLMIGATYVPLDISNPATRLQNILVDAVVTLVIGIGQKEDWCPQEVMWLSIGNLKISSVHEKFDSLYHPVDSDLAAILYTSGSSGNPKGVALSHRAMQAFADWAGKTFSVNEKDRIANLAPFYFDLSVFDLFTSLRFGAMVYYMPSELSASPLKMVKWLKEYKITLWYTVPTILTFLTLKGNLSQEYLPDLRAILFAGEVFPVPHLISLMNFLPHVEFHNLFGPTETNVCCYWTVNREEKENYTSIPIGYPACDDQLQISSNGELLVKGPSLMSGYFSKGEIKKPFDEQGWYHTGDCVSLGSQGELCYHGRLDNQLKCHGFRIEPGEIERAIYSYPNVEECIVFGIEGKAGIVLAACLGGQQAVCIPNLVRHLKNRLPLYMIPERLKQMKTLPRLGNGKLNLLKIKHIFQFD